MNAMTQSFEISPETRIGDCVARYPQLVDWCLHNQVDFCCGGGRSLASIAQERGMDIQQWVAQVEAAISSIEERETEEFPHFDETQTETLIEFILKRFHEVHRNQLAHAQELAAKVTRAHGERYPQLLRLQTLIAEMVVELEQHMVKEEQVLFPLLISIFRTRHKFGQTPARGIDPRMPMSCMRREHDEAGEHLSEMKQLTDNFTPPEGACNSFRGLYALLQELERDLMMHIHLENNVLFGFFETE